MRKAAVLCVGKRGRGTVQATSLVGTPWLGLKFEVASPARHAREGTRGVLRRQPELLLAPLHLLVGFGDVEAGGFSEAWGLFLRSRISGAGARVAAIVLFAQSISVPCVYRVLFDYQYGQTR